MAEKGVRIRIVSESVGKGFKEAQKSLSGLQSAAKKLAGAAGIGLSATAVINFGKDAIKAFAENEKSATRLAGVVKNLGLAFETPMIEKNLDEISAKYGYQGEVLREAYQKLITVTGSATKSQDLLKLSLDIAAGSGEDLVTVNQDLAALYVGNTKGLKKYNLGLTQTELKTLKYEDAVALLAKTFKGSANNELETFSGQMRVLGEAAGNAQEIIGKGLVDSLKILAGQNGGVEDLASAMNDFATDISNAIVGVATLIDKLKNIPGVNSDFGKAVSRLAQLLGPLGQVKMLFDSLSKYGAAQAEAVPLTSTNVLSGDVWLQQNKERLAAEAAAAKRAKELAALQAKAAKDKIKAEKDALKQKKLSKIFDLEYIQIYAALQGKLSEEDRTRLRLQLAIMDENVDAAENLAKKLGEAQGKTSMLATFLRTMPDAKNPFSKWGEYLTALELEAKRIAALEFNAADAGSKKTNADQGGGSGGSGGGGGGGTGGGSSGGGGGAPKTYLDYLGMGQFEVRANPYQGDVTVIVNGSVLTNQELTEAIRQGLLNASLSGSSSTTNRINGNFAAL